MSQTSIRFPPELHERLAATAAAERRTLGSLVRVLVEDALAARAREQQVVELARRVFEIPSKTG